MRTLDDALARAQETVDELRGVKEAPELTEGVEGLVNTALGGLVDIVIPAIDLAISADDDAHPEEQ